MTNLTTSCNDELSPYERASARIQEAAKTNATSLKLGSYQLSQLPPEIEGKKPDSI